MADINIGLFGIRGGRIAHIEYILRENPNLSPSQAENLFEYMRNSGILKEVRKGIFFPKGVGVARRKLIEFDEIGVSESMRTAG
ncbi:MAG: hypothetical protein ACP5D2_02445, partial [Candidatus Nanoarchaeia archaeon]